MLSEVAASLLAWTTTRHSSHTQMGVRSMNVQKKCSWSVNKVKLADMCQIQMPWQVRIKQQITLTAAVLMCCSRKGAFCALSCSCDHDGRYPSRGFEALIKNCSGFQVDGGGSSSSPFELGEKKMLIFRSAVGSTRRREGGWWDHLSVVLGK